MATAERKNFYGCMGECSLKDLMKVYNVKPGDWFMTFYPSFGVKVEPQSPVMAHVVLGQFGRAPFFKEGTPDVLFADEGFYVLGGKVAGKRGQSIIAPDVKSFRSRREVSVYHHRDRLDSTRLYVGVPEVWVGLVKEGFEYCTGLVKPLLTCSEWDKVGEKLFVAEASRRIRAGESPPENLGATGILHYIQARIRLETGSGKI